MNLHKAAPPDDRRESPKMGPGRDGSPVREHRVEPKRWRPKTQLPSSQAFFSVSKKRLNRLVARNGSRWDFRELL
jgi:hypothetical protein